jgi:hypothetical protein
VAKGKRKYWLILGLLLFLVYVFAAAQPIPEETVLFSRWISSLKSGIPLKIGDFSAEEDVLIPFQLGDRFGYVNDGGHFLINETRTNFVSISGEFWSEYEAMPSSLIIKDPQTRELLTIEEPQGYPLFLDSKLFLLGKEQNSLTALDSQGGKMWAYDFPAPLTCIDAAAGFVLAGTLDGALELLNSEGKQAIQPFEPGGSRLAVILGCAISGDASYLALVSGIDFQRFLLLERSGDTYRVVYHEFLSEGFRRAVHIAFVDEDRRVVFEREGGIGIYDIASRTVVKLPLDGEITALEKTASNDFFFLITSLGSSKKALTAVRLPGQVILHAPFSSDTAFLARISSKLYIGGGEKLLSLELGKK